jgi:hypothetical protein
VDLPLQFIPQPKVLSHSPLYYYRFVENFLFEDENGVLLKEQAMRAFVGARRKYKQISAIENTVNL